MTDNASPAILAIGAACLEYIIPTIIIPLLDDASVHTFLYIMPSTSMNQTNHL